MLGTVESIDGRLHVSGPRADVLNRLVFECASSAKNDIEVWEAFPRFFQGVMHLRSVGNVAGIPGCGVVPEL